MAEANPTFSASTASAHRSRSPLSNNMLSAVESILDPAILTISLWCVSVSFEGELLPPYLILAVIVFSITFPGASRLQVSVKRLIFDVLYSWFWVALLLLFLGFATGYIAEFSSQALTTLILRQAVQMCFLVPSVRTSTATRSFMAGFDRGDR